MMCGGICNTTGGMNFSNQIDAPIPGSRGATLDTNPLSGQPLAANQMLVTGAQITGPRKTVINVNNPDGWPDWIISVDGVPTDNGAPGGTYQPQHLPDLTVTGMSWWWIPVVILGVMVLAKASKE